MQLKILLGLTLSFGLFVGCDDGYQGEILPPPSGVGQVVLSIPTDTLWYAEGNSAQTTVSVTVIDYDGNKMSGQEISIFSNNPELGYLGYMDQELQNHTNAEGQVELQFTSAGISGQAVITVTADWLGARDSLICKAIQTEWLDSLWIERETDTLWFSQGETAVTPLTVFALNTEGNPMAGLPVAIEIGNTQLGAIEFVNEELRNVTGSLGQIQLLFRANATDGETVIMAMAEAAAASDTIVCRMLPNRIWVVIDYITGYRFGNVTLFSMRYRALYTTAHGLPLVGTILEASTTMGFPTHQLPPTDEFGVTSGHAHGTQEPGDLCITVSDGIIEDTECRTFTVN